MNQLKSYPENDRGFFVSKTISTRNGEGIITFLTYWPVHVARSIRKNQPIHTNAPLRDILYCESPTVHSTVVPKKCQMSEAFRRLNHFGCGQYDSCFPKNIA